MMAAGAQARTPTQAGVQCKKLTKVLERSSSYCSLSDEAVCCSSTARMSASKSRPSSSLTAVSRTVNASLLLPPWREEPSFDDIASSCTNRQTRCQYTRRELEWRQRETYAAVKKDLELRIREDLVAFLSKYDALLDVAQEFLDLPLLDELAGGVVARAAVGAHELLDVLVGKLELAFANDELLEPALLARPLEDALLDRVCRDEAEHEHGLSLADAVRSVHGLQVDLRAVDRVRADETAPK